jgi:hypothetical protein
MNDRNYRKYSQEFKLEALELLQRGDKSAGQIERELGITPGLSFPTIFSIEAQGCWIGSIVYLDPCAPTGLPFFF